VIIDLEDVSVAWAIMRQRKTRISLRGIKIAAAASCCSRIR